MNFAMIRIGGNLKARGLVSVMNKEKHRNQAPTSFVELSKTNEAALP